MTASYPRHAFNVVPGQPQPTVFTPVAEFFRRALRLVQRRSPAPAECPPAGAFAALLADPQAPRFACCPCCVTENTDTCEPRDNHLAPCGDGCNDVLGDRMLSEVRATYDRGEHPYLPAPSFTPAMPVFTPSQAMSTGELEVLDERVDKLLAAEADRAAYVRSHMAETRSATPELLERVRDGLLKLGEPAFGVDRCEADVLEAERLAEAMRP